MMGSNAEKNNLFCALDARVRGNSKQSKTWIATMAESSNKSPERISEVLDAIHGRLIEALRPIMDDASLQRQQEAKAAALVICQEELNLTGKVASLFCERVVESYFS